jgi:hypothetical protein
MLRLLLMAELPNLPEWELQLRDDMEASRLRLWPIYRTRWHHFGGCCTAAQLKSKLLERGCKWADVHRSTVYRWMRRVDEMRAAAIRKLEKRQRK